MQQRKGAEDVGVDKAARCADGVVDMAFGGQVDEAAGLVLFEQIGEDVALVDVCLHKSVALMAECTGQRAEVAGVGEFVDVDDMVISIDQ